MREECGVVGVSLQDDARAALPIYYALFALQHRGQESAGITTLFNDEHQTLKRMGLVPDAFKKDDLSQLNGNMGVGHVRYSTTGSSKIENAQPLLVNYKDGVIAIAHNGNLANSQELREDLEAEGRVFLSDSDTEVIAHLLVKGLLRRDLESAMHDLIRVLRGSYSLVIQTNEEVIAVRDPLGIKPLCLGKLDNGYIVASESVAIDTLGGEFLRDVQPGEMLILRDDDLKSTRIARCNNTAHCVFEFIYFARPDSVMDGRLVYDVRHKIGKILHEEYPVEADIVSPVPDSGVTLAIGHATESGIEYLESLMKNRYVGRTFIMPGQEMREAAVRVKLNVIRHNIQGKKIVLVDDSIVRGTTSHRIIDILRQHGAEEVHMRVGSPPIISPCYLGIDMATREELIAGYKTVEGVEHMIGADSLGYLSHEGLVEAVGISKENLCMGCLTGVYPVEIEGEECLARQQRLSQF